MSSSRQRCRGISRAGHLRLVGAQAPSWCLMVFNKIYKTNFELASLRRGGRTRAFKLAVIRWRPFVGKNKNHSRKQQAFRENKQPTRENTQSHSRKQFVLCFRPFCYVTLGQQEAKTSNAGESKKQFPKPFQRLREGLRAQGLRKLTGGVREASGVL